MDSITREYPRSSKRIRAMITISLDGQTGAATVRSGRKDKGIKLLAETKDISWAGFSLKFSSLPDDPDNRFSPARAHSLVGQPIKVSLSHPNVTIWGDVIRFDSPAREMAVIITKVSDYDLWQKLCSLETD